MINELLEKMRAELAKKQQECITNTVENLAYNTKQAALRIKGFEDAIEFVESIKGGL